MNGEFQFDVFLSHSVKNKAGVRPLAERLRKDGLKVWFDEWECPSPAGAGEGGRGPGEGFGAEGDSIPAKIEEGLERSRVLVLCIRRWRIRFCFRSGPALNFSDRLIELACAPACAIPQGSCLPSLERHERRSWHARNQGSRQPR